MEFISYSEAVSITGKSEKTIRRLVSNFRNTNRVNKKGRTIYFDRLILGDLDVGPDVQPSTDNTRETEALKDHIQSLKDQVSDLQKRLDDKDRLLQEIDAKLIALFEGRQSNKPVLRIIPSDIEEAPADDLPKDFTERTFSGWLSQMKQG
jgi:chromosome segregation ATPase